MWKQKRNLVLLVSFLILLVVITASYFLYKNWQKNKELDEARAVRETILNDLVNIEYDAKKTAENRREDRCPYCKLNLGL